MESLIFFITKIDCRFYFFAAGIKPQKSSLSHLLGEQNAILCKRVVKNRILVYN